MPFAVYSRSEEKCPENVHAGCLCSRIDLWRRSTYSPCLPGAFWGKRRTLHSRTAFELHTQNAIAVNSNSSRSESAIVKAEKLQQCYVMLVVQCAKSSSLMECGHARQKNLHARHLYWFARHSIVRCVRDTTCERETKKTFSNTSSSVQFI